MNKYIKLKLSDGSTIDEHRFVMQNHIGRTLTTNEVVHHIDGDKSNNDISNLELTDRSTHTKSHWADGTYVHKPHTPESKMKISLASRGSNSGVAKVSENDVIRIKMMLRDGIKPSVISKQFPISRKTISNINCGVSWKHVII